tara:strand:- start:584 stop:1456 length:873 start_codon:yes stop_codon:yes gene_type:complete
MKCLICGKKKFKIIWNDKIRSGINKFTKKKEKILQCENCELVFLKKRKKILENSALTRKHFNKNNSIKEFVKFHSTREFKKFNFIKKYLNFEKKDILESNCGAGLIINALKKKAKTTAGIDNPIYEKFLTNNNHLFFKNVDETIIKKIKFDIIFSLSEIEHKFDPILFIKKIRKILKKNGYLILRIPNFKNIYSYLLHKSFFRYDFRTSHNYYFSENNLDLMFKKLNFKIHLKRGFNEYSLNHLSTYMIKNKRVKTKDVKNIFNLKTSQRVLENIEKSNVSTSFIYILKN